MKPLSLFFKYHLLQTLCFCLFTLSALAQKTHLPLNLNLDFEQLNKGIPLNWNLSLNNKYESKIDSINVQKGKYSISIKHKEGSGGFGLFSLTIPLSYPGKKITLSGYIKTENVDGYAGLWMRIDPQIAFDNMHKKSIKGNTDWTKYEINLDLNPEKTTSITIGGILVGKGKVWMDNLTLQIDGKDISTLTPILKKPYPAESDHEFDSTSKIIPFALDKNKTKDLQDLGLIWGFLKYYHPQIAAGNHNWDYALFRILPQVIASTSQQLRDQILTTWIKSLGDFEIDSQLTSPVTEDLKIAPDLDWIQTSGFSKNLQKELLRVKKAKRRGDHFYISQNPAVGNPVIKNENSYRNIPMTDVGYRILSLYRYWNLIHYYFPYKNLIDQDWKEVLHDYIPKMIAADDVQAYTLTTLQLIGNIYDTHANISGNNSVLNNFKGTRYAPLEFTFIENKAVITGFHDQQKGVQTGLKIGDVLTSINGNAIDQIIQEKLKYYPASNYSTQLRDIAIDLLRTNDTLVQIEYLQDNKIVDQTIKTYSTDEINIYKKYQLKDVSIRMISPEIAYINNGKLNRTSLPQVIEQLKNTKGMIIDCRNYPSDIPMIYEFAKYLLPTATSFTKFTVGSLTTPGEFTFINDLYVGIKNDDYYQGKIMILVNEITQSASEFYAMAYSVHPNAQVIGSTTAGADGNISSFFLPGGISTMFSGVGVYYPNKAETQRVGIKIDIECKPTIKGIQAGKDEVLEKAIQLLGQ